MEEDALYRGDAFGEQMTMRNHIAVNKVITLNNFVTPTADMEMRIRVEELQPEGFAGCYPHKTVRCRSGKLNWTICNNN
eukprot:11913168-Heterocapsa_arctica.AAC.1